MSKITQYTTLSSVQKDDVLPIVDVHDTSMAASGTTKKVTLGNLQSVDWLNVVTQYGADPTGVADSTTAIQNAISAASAAGGGVVYFPAGTYKITSALTLGSNITLQGDGDQVSIIKQSSTSANGVTISNSSTELDSPRILGLQVLGPGSGSGIGVAAVCSAGANPVVGLVMRDVVISGFGGYGLDAQVLVTSVLENVEAVSCGGGFHIYGGGTSTSLTGCYANNCTGRGYYIVGQAYSALTGCAADNCYLGYEISSSATIALTGCGAEGIAAGGALDGTSFKINGSFTVSLTSCRSLTNNAAAFWVTGGSQCVALTGVEEISPGGSATASIKTDSATMSTLAGYRRTTALSLTSGTYSEVNDGTSGEQTIAGTSFLNATNMFGTLNMHGNSILASGGVDVSVAGAGLAVAEGSNAKQGTVALVAGSKVVSNTSVTANSRIFLTSNADGGTPGWLRVSARTAGTSFTITSSSGTDTSTVAYEIFEPG